jgi:hypothetical protein
VSCEVNNSSPCKQWFVHDGFRMAKYSPRWSLLEYMSNISVCVIFSVWCGVSVELSVIGLLINMRGGPLL